MNTETTTSMITIITILRTAIHSKTDIINIRLRQAA